MNPSFSKKIIVIGGSGETGKRIIYHLSHHYPNIMISSAARRRQKGLLLAPNVDAVTLDTSDHHLTIALVKKYDLAILALGPMEKHKASVHKLCLQAGTDVIDINDSLEAADDIYALDDIAKQKGQSVFTGMGFSPGLSTLLLMLLSNKNSSPKDHYHCRLYMGAAYGGGETSPYAMLASFKNTLSCWEDNTRLIKKTPWKDHNSQFLFPGQSKKLDLIPYATPEITGLSSSRQVLSTIATLDSRYHIQFLTQGFAKFLAKFQNKKGVIEFFAKKFYTSGQSIKQKKNADPNTSLWVYPDNDPEKGLLIHGVVSSYDLTGIMACAATDCWLDGSLTLYQGVYGVEHLRSETLEQLSHALKRRGVSYRESTKDNINHANIHFGWVSPQANEVEKLRNFGKNWYTYDIPHPKIEDLQKQFLFDSDIWKALKQALNKVQFTQFVIRVLFRWKAHNKKLENYRKKCPAEFTEQWQRITKDMSMFTSGYSAAREILGQDKAFELYRRMFLDTGKMEMRWLWPAPETFSAFTSPEAEVKQYWLEFMKNYQALGLFELDITELNAYQLQCKISQCMYAKMFTKLGCPELSNMVREMEEEALKHIASHSDLTIEWTTQQNGSATVFLNNGSQNTVVSEIENATLDDMEVAAI